MDKGLKLGVQEPSGYKEVIWGMAASPWQHSAYWAKWNDTVTSD